MKYINPINTILRNHLLYYPTPTSLSYFWNFGSLAGFCLIIQILSGLFLAMHYTADTISAFDSVEHIMRDVNYGWLLRYTHSNGASMFLLVVYIHMARGLFFRSYVAPRQHLWYSGVGLFLLLMATAFLGYVLPWGQMSLWGATVITNLATAIPLVGQKIAYWLWGGYSVDNATLTRFFTFHFLVPFLMVGLTLIHLALLHVDGSNSPLCIEGSDFIPFYPYFIVKDVFGFLVFLFIFSYLVFFEPNLLGHPDNYIRANPLITPPHIVPEWYFLPFYAILRAVPSKLGGVIAMGASIGILFLLPSLDKGRFKSLQSGLAGKHMEVMAPVSSGITTVGSDMGEFIVFTGDNQLALDGWGVYGLLLLVTGVVGSVGAVYYHFNHKVCFVEEVVTASTARWEGDSDLFNGANPFVQEGYTEVFAEKLAELSPEALLFATVESKKAFSFLGANLKYLVADTVTIPQSAYPQRLTPRHSKESLLDSIQEQINGAFSIDRAESAEIETQKVFTIKENLYLFVNKTLAEIETQKVFTITENLAFFMDHTPVCAQVMPCTFGLLTVGTAFSASVGCCIAGTTILVSKLLYSSLTKMWGTGKV